MNPGAEATTENLSLRHAARRLGVSQHTLRSWAVYQHRLPFFRIGRRILFAPADLDGFLSQHRVPARDELPTGDGAGGGDAPGHSDPARRAPFTGRIRRAR
jgi:excisionase family DNA binding protein